jgi:hypothetical protein
MNLYLAGTQSREYAVEKSMNIYLAAIGSGIGAAYLENTDPKPLAQPGLYILDSFFYVNDWMFPYIDNKVWNFMLDSGAFTFIKQKSKGITTRASTDWDDYVCRYADFIVEHDVDLFLELDIDVVVGLSRVERLRHTLEARTGRQCIPVWHRSRGLDYWKGMVKDYQYVAIGGLAIKVIHRSEYKYLNQLCDIAHETRTRVHGLGFTPPSGFAKYRFDSVDSTNWTIGNRSGYLDVFTGTGLRKVRCPTGTRLKPRETAKHNFAEWVKYQRYMLHAGWSLTTNGSDHDPVK